MAGEERGDRLRHLLTGDHKLEQGYTEHHQHDGSACLDGVETDLEKVLQCKLFVYEESEDHGVQSGEHGSFGGGEVTREDTYKDDYRS